MNREIILTDKEILLKFRIKEGYSTMDFTVSYNESDFMDDIIQAFFERERNKIKHLQDSKKCKRQWASIASEADEMARQEFVRHFLAGWGYSHEWIESCKKVRKNCGVKRNNK